MSKKDGKKQKKDKSEIQEEGSAHTKLSRKDYERELETLQAELVALQEWVKKTGQRMIVVFEGRDAAG